MKSISIIGHGKVGATLATALKLAGFEVRRVVVRNGDSDSRADGIPLVSWSQFERIDSDVVVIATGDSDIPEADRALARLDGIDGSQVLHTSGLHSSSILVESDGAGAFTGSMHPLSSFPDSLGGASRFKGISFCLEGDARAVVAAEELIAGLGGESFTVETEFKSLYHASAVMACGNLVALISEAVRMMGLCGMDEKESLRRLGPLIKGTVDNVLNDGVASSLTGPFARLDEGAVQTDLSAVDAVGDEKLRELFSLLGRISIRLAVARGGDTEKARKILDQM